MFCVVWDYSFSKLKREKYKQNSLLKSCKNEIKILANPAFISLIGFEQPGPEVKLKPNVSRSQLRSYMWSPSQTIATCHRNILQHCLVQGVWLIWPPCCVMLGDVGSNLSQQHPTCRNTSQHGGQMHATCCAQQCWNMLRWDVAIVWPGLNYFEVWLVHCTLVCPFWLVNVVTYGDCEYKVLNKIIFRESRLTVLVNLQS